MKKLAVAAALVLLATLASTSQSGAGEPSDNGGSATKVVVGPGPVGPYLFQLDCDGATTNFQLNDGGTTGGSLPGTSCTLTETDDLGADSVTYTCQIVSGPGSCSVDGQTVTLPVGAAPTVVEWTVTNTFAEPTTTTTTSVAPTTTAAPTTTTTAPVARAVAITPTFTG